ncbi:MAG: plasmid pRiA4b ORF-3 family protein [Planctomycetota bacterium]
MTKTKSIYEIRVTLRWIKPPVWRRLLVRSDITFAALHETLQWAIGWTDSHLHVFRHDGGEIGKPDPGLLTPARDERKLRLDDVLRRPKDRLVYEYDFGDGWEHDVVLERVHVAEPGGKYPLVLGGRRACPPEDCGGPPGYANLLDARSDPSHPEHAELSDWLGGAFDPEAFDVPEKNRQWHGGWGPEVADAARPDPPDGSRRGRPRRR